jgi:hypothetical protein
MRVLTILSFCIPVAVAAQVALPYTTGFDNAAQQQGWQEFRYGQLSNYSWSMSTLDPVSPPNRLWHDYPVGGAATDTVRDWYVSPALDLAGGANLTCQVNVYSITGSTMPSDGCGIFLLTGSPDPEIATSITPLMDLLPLVTSSNTYTQIPAISIPPTAGVAHIAFFYQATQNWLTPGIDDVSITPANVGIAEPVGGPAQVLVYPNPGHGPVTLEMRDAGHAGQLLRLRVFDARGALVLERPFRGKTQLDLPTADGEYAYTLADDGGTEVARGRLQRVR